MKKVALIAAFTLTLAGLADAQTPERAMTLEQRDQLRTLYGEALRATARLNADFLSCAGHLQSIHHKLAADAVMFGVENNILPQSEIRDAYEDEFNFTLSRTRGRCGQIGDTIEDRTKAQRALNKFYHALPAGNR